MHETLLDQLPVLIDLKQFISRMTIAGSSTSSKTQNLLLEDLPQIQKELIKEVERDGGFYQVAQSQDGVFLNKNKEDICALATKLSNAYGTEILCELEQNMADNELPKPQKKTDSDGGGHEHLCGICKEPAKKKCAKCKKVHYCSRQVSYLIYDGNCTIFTKSLSFSSQGMPAQRLASAQGCLQGNLILN